MFEAGVRYKYFIMASNATLQGALSELGDEQRAHRDLVLLPSAVPDLEVGR